VSEQTRVYGVGLGDGALETVAGVRRARCAAGIGCDPAAAQPEEIASQTVLDGVMGGVAVAPDGTIYLAENFK
jgi:hypothetical protein